MLEGPSRWHTLEHHDQVGSTNDLVAAAARAGAPAGLVVSADRQSAGRGRRGRVWEDQPEGRSLAVSVLVAAPAAGATLVPLATGLAVADAFAEHGGRPRLKWPNDVLLPVAEGGRPAKAGGILVEHHGEHLVIGVGLNLDWRGHAGDDGEPGRVSLAGSTARDVDRWAVLADLLRALDRRLHQAADEPDRLLVDYGARCQTLGQQVRVVTATGELTGTADGIGRDGSLELSTPSGVVVVTEGDVIHLR